MNSVYLNRCRLCASSCENFVPIFEEGGLSNFADKIRSYLHVEITHSNDSNDVPRMCNTCSEKIINWDQYAEKVQKVQGMFMSLATSEDKDEFLKKLNRELNMDVVKQGCDDKSAQGVKCKEVEKVGEKKKGKGKSCKKIKKVVSEQNYDSDFSQEDNIPLGLQIDCSLGTKLKNRLLNALDKAGVGGGGGGGGEGERQEEGDKSIYIIELKEKGKEEDVEEARDVEDCSMDGEEADDKDNDCGSNSGSKDEAKRKSNEPSLFTWECMKCQAQAKNWNALVKYCRETHDSNPVVTCICGEQLQSRPAILKHKMKHTGGYRYKCGYENCKRMFYKKQMLDVHVLSHVPKEQQPWMCCKCSRRFHSGSLLKQHEKVHLPKEEKLIHECEVCKKRFCSKSAVAAHVRTVHFGERPYVCDQCGHSFTSKGILYEHLTIHSDVYNYHCKKCNKSFKTKYRLKIHMDTHVETRYKCPLCTLTLNTRRTLRMHLLVHQDDKAFQCTTCGKAFKRSKDLKNHYNMHTGKRPYTCPFCLRTFANGSNCRSHKRRMHPQELKLYEEAIAAGQEPIIIRAEDEKESQTKATPNKSVVYDSNESNSGVSEAGQKLSEEEEGRTTEEIKLLKVLNEAVILDQDKYETVNEIVILEQDDIDEADPLDLVRGGRKAVKVGERKGEETVIVLGGEGVNGAKEKEGEGGEEEGTVVQTFTISEEDNITEIEFTDQAETLHYPVQNLFTFQSSGIPAFPGNPFLRQ